MSMGYDYDDPRDQEVRDRLRSGYYKLPEGQKPNVHASKFRAGTCRDNRKLIVR